MEAIFTSLLRQPISFVAAGRTDTGVHAKYMIAHFDSIEHIDQIELVQRLNGFLPADIAVQEIFQVASDTHARFHAIERTYEYWITTKKNPFYTNSSYYVNQSLDIEAMNKVAAILLEYKDFKCFSKSKTGVKTNLCDIRTAFWSPSGEQFVFTISADRFLRNMVRAIVGTLLDVGLGKKELYDVEEIIKSGDRARAGASVPAKGLYLSHILYPQHIIKVNG